VHNITQAAAPVVNDITEPVKDVTEQVTNAVPPPVGKAVDDVAGTVQQGTGITLP
jgi:hypothetical protein